jgi:hypothetical protein
MIQLSLFICVPCIWNTCHCNVLAWNTTLTHIIILQVGSVTSKSPSTDVFDMIPFSPISIPARNGTQPPPVPTRSAEISKLSKSINISCYIWVYFTCLIDTLWEITYLNKLTRIFYWSIKYLYINQIQLILF